MLDHLVARATAENVGIIGEAYVKYNFITILFKSLQLISHAVQFCPHLLTLENQLLQDTDILLNPFGGSQLNITGASLPNMFEFILKSSTLKVRTVILR